MVTRLTPAVVRTSAQARYPSWQATIVVMVVLRHVVLSIAQARYPSWQPPETYIHSISLSIFHSLRHDTPPVTLTYRIPTSPCNIFQSLRRDTPHGNPPT